MPKNPGTKMLSEVKVMAESWRERAERFFYEEGCTIVEIADRTGISRQSIAAHLAQTPGYEAERARRIEANKARRKDYKRAKNKEYRDKEAYRMQVTADTMRREHEIAVMLLSHERR